MGHRNLYVAMKKKSETNMNIMLIQVQTASICNRLSIGIPLMGAQRTWLVGFGDTFSFGVCDGSGATNVSDDEFILMYEKWMEGVYMCVCKRRRRRRRFST